MDVYVACHVRVRNVVLRQIGGLVRTIGAGASAVLDLVANPAEGGDNLVGHVLNILTAKNRPTRRLVETVLAVHGDRPNAQLLVYVTPGMTRDELSAHLPALVSLSKASLADAFDRMLRASKPRPMEASEVLVAIHMLDPRRDGVRLKAIADAIKVCFEAKAHFDADALATALHQMVDKYVVMVGWGWGVRGGSLSSFCGYFFFATFRSQSHFVTGTRFRRYSCEQ